MATTTIEYRVLPGTRAAVGRADTHSVIADRPDGKAGGMGLGFNGGELIALAIGQATATDVAKGFSGVQIDTKGRVVVNAMYRTANPKVWAGGDCVNGGKEVVNAVQEAKLAVRDIVQHLGGK